MRSLNEIVIAVQNCEPCTDEELRLCVMALYYRDFQSKWAMDELSVLADKGDSKTRLRALLWLRDADSRFKGGKMPVDEFLGPGNIPWNDEYKRRLRMAEAVFEKATGIKL